MYETASGTACRRAAALPSPTNEGPSIERLDPRAATLICRQAIANDPDNLNLYAYLARALVKGDRGKEAFDLLFPLRERGSLPVTVYLAVMYESGYGVEQDVGEAMRWYQTAAYRGDATAQLNLGILYDNGDGVTQDYAEAIRWYRMSADQGNADAEFNLGTKYDNGEGVPRDYKEAIRWYRKAADQGNASAQTNLGVKYDNGEGVPQDDKEAIRWYRKAADQGDASAQNNLGVKYDNGEGVPQNYPEAMRWYRKAAQQGNVTAQRNLGLHYHNGQGVPQDNVEAMRWYRKAADQEDAAGQLSVGNMYERGEGVSQDYAEAVRWYRKAADHGYAAAQNNLGAMYFSGQGVARDFGEAMRWCRKAADQGDADGEDNIGSMFENGQGVARDYAEAVRWYRRAADQGSFNAVTNLGRMSEMGLGIPQDYTEAMRWYRIAADQKYYVAQANVGSMYRNGTGVPQDFSEAMRWYRKAADQDYAEAQDVVGDMYRDGRGVRQDVFEAVRWYRKAADRGISGGQASLGFSYAEGQGVSQDYTEAVRWYRLAADQGDAEAQYELAGLLESGRGVAKDDGEALGWYLKAAQGGNDQSRELISRVYLNEKDPLHAQLVTIPDLRSSLHDAAMDIGLSFEENEIDCFSYLSDCGEISWRRLDLEKAASWYRMVAATDAQAAFLLGRLLDAHPEFEQSPGEALVRLNFAAGTNNAEAKFMLATRDLSPVPEERNARVETALSSMSQEKAVELAFYGATGRFGDRVIGPSYLYLKTRSDRGATEAAIGLIYVYSFYGAYEQAETVANTLWSAKWFELSGWDYSIDHLLDFWLEQVSKGNQPREGSLKGLEHLLSTLSAKGSPVAGTLLSKLNSVKEAVAAAHPAASAADPTSTRTPTTAEWEATIQRIQARIAEKQKLGGLSFLIVELYQALSKAQAAVGQKEEATQSALIALSVSEQINAATRYQKGSLIYHLEQSCQLRKASEYLNSLDQNEVSLLLAKAAVNELQDARTELAGLPAGLQGCFRDQVSDQYRVLADLFIRQGHFLEAEWVLGQLKDFETYEFNRGQEAYAGGALGRTPMTDAQSQVLAQIVSLPLQELARLDRRVKDLNKDADPSDEIRLEKTQLNAQLFRAKKELNTQLVALKSNIATLKPPEETADLSFDLSSDKITTLAADLRELPANTAIFYTAVLPEKIHILITTRAGTEHIEIPIQEVQLNSMIGEARTSLQDRAKDPTSALRALYDLLWKAAEPELQKGGVSDVILSLDRRLRYLPFSALYDGQSYLIDRYRFTLLTSKRRDQLLAPGGLSDLTVQALGTSLGRTPDFDPLPNVPREIDGIVKDPSSDALGLLPGKRWLDDAFNRNGLGAALASEAPIIHIATHFSVGASDETSRLLLGDGPMSLKDIKAGIDSRSLAFSDVKLLVLSACETAFGGNGNELESLAAVMQDHGVKSVIATLWPIADQSTAAFMVRFYTYLQAGYPRGEALRRTQIDFIHNRQDRSINSQATQTTDDASSKTDNPAFPADSATAFSHPRYWAPFILMGQWK
ncbi:CHAT domain-containing protein [Rhizobium leguminosarum]|uniref:CHAT domain-containing protein n=1 Tax=Rhizobium ruizarguesonis TaxID=2081791 RepID=UPI0013DEC221|nr:CHAT domain-containing protein [Rhizobium ruizarguesonis]NEJ17647.1 CHAT domain-containing protein [Rhizobium ruizarguesonis]